MYLFKNKKSIKKNSLEKLDKKELCQLKNILGGIIIKQQSPPILKRINSLRPVIPVRTSSLNWRLK